MKRLLKASPYLLLVVALLVLTVGVLHSRTPALHVEPTPTPKVDVPVAPLKARIPTHVLIVSKAPITPAQRARLIAVTKARASLAVTAGTVFIGKGETMAVGVDPSAFRSWTPKGTAESNPVWQAVANGAGAVAHVVGRAFELPLGGEVLAQGTFPLSLEVGAFATTALPGIGLVVDRDRAIGLGLEPGTGLLLSIPQRDPELSAKLARSVMPAMSINAVQYDRVPVTRNGWVIPAVGRITSGFGPRMHPIKHVVLFHDGIDIGAPYGAPVYAMSDGVVLYAGPARGFGTEVVLSHPGGITTVYGHVSRILVHSGPVRAGQPIALVGNEGESTGPHLHAEVRINDRPVDPIAWLRAHGVRL
ncbi:MAG: Peptidase [Frankiales bacterium]|nr:Peptidase [Frankiales bacterium]